MPHPYTLVWDQASTYLGMRFDSLLAQTEEERRFDPFDETLRRLKSDKSLFSYPIDTIFICISN